MYAIFLCEQFGRSSFQKRQIDGALSRVPTDFYEHVWSILERTPQGIKLCGILLPQVNSEEI
jgi:phosphorylase kinase alpha/beta subunit